MSGFFLAKFTSYCAGIGVGDNVEWDDDELERELAELLGHQQSDTGQWPYFSNLPTQLYFYGI